MWVPMWLLWTLGVPCAIALLFSAGFGLLWAWIEFEQWLWKRKRNSRPNEDWWF